MKINYPLISRSLIALVFVLAGVGKIMSFSSTAALVGKLGVPLPMLAILIAIIIEVPIALLYAWGYRICITGGALAIFTVLVTVIMHHDLSNQINLVMALKNIAIIGGILATTTLCDCGKCPMGKWCKNCGKNGKCAVHA